MANEILDKSFAVATGSAVTRGTCAVFVTNDQTVTLATTAGGPVLGVYQETIDAAKIATGKAVAAVRVIGIARVKATGVIARGSRVKVTATGTVIQTAETTGLKENVVGVALQTAAVNDEIDVLLTPGVAVYTP